MPRENERARPFSDARLRRPAASPGGRLGLGLGLGGARSVAVCAFAIAFAAPSALAEGNLSGGGGRPVAMVETPAADRAASGAARAAVRADAASGLDGGAHVCGAPALPRNPGPSSTRFSPAAADAAAPWMAKLEVLERVGRDGEMTVSNCGAAALSERWLITAAHCVGSTPWLSMTATLGARNLADAAALRRGAEVAICHAGFEPDTLKHDVALVRLSEPLPAGFPTLRLASRAEGSALRVGGRAVSAGWSRLTSARISSELRRASVRVVDPGRRRDGMIVAAPERDEGSLCVGESGGPLVADLGRGPALLGVFSSVDAYRDPETGELVELCDGFEARSYFTPTAGLEAWAAAAIHACEQDLAACRAAGL